MARHIDPNLNAISRVSTETVIKGEIFSKNDIRIDGTFEGKIYSEGKVVVGESAKVIGDIICRNVDFWGTIQGSMYVRDTLSLKDGCHVKADLHVRRIMLELGTSFNGTCEMIDEAAFDKIAESSGRAEHAETLGQMPENAKNAKSK